MNIPETLNSPPLKRKVVSGKLLQDNIVTGGFGRREFTVQISYFSLGRLILILRTTRVQPNIESYDAKLLDSLTSQQAAQGKAMDLWAALRHVTLIVQNAPTCTPSTPTLSCDDLVGLSISLSQWHAFNVEAWHSQDWSFDLECRSVELICN